MAAGLPTVTSDLPHQISVIEGADSGILAQPEEPKSFVKAICKLIDDKEQAYKLGLNGQAAFIDKYSWESQIPDLIDMYDHIVNKSDQEQSSNEN